MNKLRRMLQVAFGALFLVCVMLFAASCDLFGTGNSTVDTVSYNVSVSLNDASLGEVILEGDKVGDGYRAGSMLTVIVNPIEDYEAELSINGEDVELDENNTAEVQVNSDLAVVADIEYIYTINVVNDDSKGKVTIETQPGDNGLYAKDGTITFTVAPKTRESDHVPLYVVDRVTVNGVEPTADGNNEYSFTLGTDGKYTFKLTEKSYIAVEYKTRYEVSVTATDGGTVNHVPTEGNPDVFKDTLFTEGEVITLEPKANSWYIVGDVYVNGALTAVDKDGRFSFTVKGETEVQVNFRKILRLSFRAWLNGALTTVGEEKAEFISGEIVNSKYAPEGAEISFNVQAKKDYVIDKVLVDGKPVELHNGIGTFIAAENSAHENWAIVDVYYAHKSYTIDYSSGDDGMRGNAEIVINKSNPDLYIVEKTAGAVKVQSGTPVILQIKPLPGFMLNYLRVNNRAVYYAGEENDLVFENGVWNYSFTVKEDIELFVDFTKAPHFDVTNKVTNEVTSSGEEEIKPYLSEPTTQLAVEEVTLKGSDGVEHTIPNPYYDATCAKKYYYGECVTLYAGEGNVFIDDIVLTTPEGAEIKTISLAELKKTEKFVSEVSFYVTQDTVITSVVKELTHNVTLNYNNETVTEPKTLSIKHGEAINLSDLTAHDLPAAAWAGHRLVGWQVVINDVAQADYVNGEFTVADDNIVLNAVWVEIWSGTLTITGADKDENNFVELWFERKVAEDEYVRVQPGDPSIIEGAEGKIDIDSTVSFTLDVDVYVCVIVRSSVAYKVGFTLVDGFGPIAVSTPSPEDVGTWSVGGPESKTNPLSWSEFNDYDIAFIEYNHNVTLESNDGGTVELMNGETPVDTPATIANGTTLTLTATPEDTYRVKSIKVNGEELDLNAKNIYEIRITADTAIVVEFVKTYTVSLKIKGDATLGGVTITNVTTGKQLTDGSLFDAGDKISVSIKEENADSHYYVVLYKMILPGYFLKVDAPNGSRWSSGGTYTATPNGNVEVELEFVKFYNVTVENNKTQGTVTVEQENFNDGMFEADEQVTVKIAAKEGYRIGAIEAEGVTVNSNLNGVVTEYNLVFMMPDADVTIKITYVKIFKVTEYTINTPELAVQPVTIKYGEGVQGFRADGQTPIEGTEMQSDDIVDAGTTFCVIVNTIDGYCFGPNTVIKGGWFSLSGATLNGGISLGYMEITQDVTVHIDIVEREKFSVTITSVKDINHEDGDPEGYKASNYVMLSEALFKDRGYYLGEEVTVSLTNIAPNYVYDSTTNTFRNASRNYRITKVTVNGSEIQPDANGEFVFTVEEESEIAVEIVRIFKLGLTVVDDTYNEDTIGSVEFKNVENPEITYADGAWIDEGTNVEVDLSILNSDFCITNSLLNAAPQVLFNQSATYYGREGSMIGYSNQFEVSQDIYAEIHFSHYRVAIEFDDGVGGAETQQHETKNAYTFPAEPATKPFDNCRFGGWKVTYADGNTKMFNPGETERFSDNASVTAVWEYKVTKSVEIINFTEEDQQGKDAVHFYGDYPAEGVLAETFVGEYYSGDKIRVVAQEGYRLLKVTVKYADGSTVETPIGEDVLWDEHVITGIEGPVEIDVVVEEYYTVNLTISGMPEGAKIVAQDGGLYFNTERVYTENGTYTFYFGKGTFNTIYFLLLDAYKINVDDGIYEPDVLFTEYGDEFIGIWGNGDGEENDGNFKEGDRVIGYSYDIEEILPLVEKNHNIVNLNVEYVDYTHTVTVNGVAQDPVKNGGSFTVPDDTSKPTQPSEAAKGAWKYCYLLNGKYYAAVGDVIEDVREDLTITGGEWLDVYTFEYTVVDRPETDDPITLTITDAKGNVYEAGKQYLIPYDSKLTLTYKANNWWQVEAEGHYYLDGQEKSQSLRLIDSVEREFGPQVGTPWVRLTLTFHHTHFVHTVYTDTDHVKVEIVGNTTNYEGAYCDEGKEVTLNFTPDAGYRVTGITINGAPLEVENNTVTFNVDDYNKDGKFVYALVIVVKTVKTYTVTVNVDGEAHGSFTIYNGTNDQIHVNEEGVSDPIDEGTSIRIVPNFESNDWWVVFDNCNYGTNEGLHQGNGSSVRGGNLLSITLPNLTDNVVLNVSYHANHDVTVDGVVKGVYDGDSYTLPAAPKARDNYRFAGWKVVKTSTPEEVVEECANAKSEITVEDDLTVTAIWIETYTFEFTVNGLNADENNALKISVKKTDGTVVDTYDFSDIADGSKSITLDADEIFNVIVTASVSYKIVYEFTGTMSLGSEMTPLPTDRGTWTYGSETSSISFKKDSGEGLSISFELYRHKVTFDGEVIEDEARWAINGRMVTLGHPDPGYETYNGYTFDKYIVIEGEKTTLCDQDTAYGEVYGELTIYSRWTYEVTVNVNTVSGDPDAVGGTVTTEGGVVPVTYYWSLDQEETPLYISANEGYLVTKVEYEFHCNGEKGATEYTLKDDKHLIYFGVDGHTTLTVTFTKIYKVTVNSTEGDVQQTTVMYGDSYTLPAAPTKVGYTFAGWDVNGASYEAQGVVENIQDDLTVTSKWTFAITVNADENAVVERLVDIVTDKREPLESSYPESEEGINVIITAKEGYRIKSVTVKSGEYEFPEDISLNTLTPSVTVTVSEDATIIVETVKVYTITVTGSNIETTITVDDGAYLYHNEEANTYTLDAGSDYYILVTPTEGYMIKKVTNQSTESVLYDAFAELAPGLGMNGGSEQYSNGFEKTTIVMDTVYAVETATRYTVTVDRQGSTLSNFTRNVIEGYEYPLPAPGTKEGFTFTGWKVEGIDGVDVKQANEKITIGEANVKITAQWVSNAQETHTVTVNEVEGATGVLSPAALGENKYYEGEEITLTVNVESGYTLDSVIIDENKQQPTEGNTYTFTMGKSDIVININVHKLHKVTIGNTENANVEITDEKEWYDNGETVTFTVSAHDGYKVTGVAVSGATLQSETEGTYVYKINEDAEHGADIVITVTTVKIKLDGVDFPTVDGSKENTSGAPAQGTWTSGEKSDLVIGMNTMQIGGAYVTEIRTQGEGGEVVYTLTTENNETYTLAWLGQTANYVLVLTAQPAQPQIALASAMPTENAGGVNYYVNSALADDILHAAWAETLGGEWTNESGVLNISNADGKLALTLDGAAAAYIIAAGEGRYFVVMEGGVAAYVMTVSDGGISLDGTLYAKKVEKKIENIHNGVLDPDGTLLFFAALTGYSVEEANEARLILNEQYSLSLKEQINSVDGFVAFRFNLSQAGIKEAVELYPSLQIGEVTVKLVAWTGAAWAGTYEDKENSLIYTLYADLTMEVKITVTAKEVKPTYEFTVASAKLTQDGGLELNITGSGTDKISGAELYEIGKENAFAQMVSHENGKIVIGGVCNSDSLRCQLILKIGVEGGEQIEVALTGIADVSSESITLGEGDNQYTYHLEGGKDGAPLTVVGEKKTDAIPEITAFNDSNIIVSGDGFQVIIRFVATGYRDVEAVKADLTLRVNDFDAPVGHVDTAAGNVYIVFFNVTVNDLSDWVSGDSFTLSLESQLSGTHDKIANSVSAAQNQVIIGKSTYTLKLDENGYLILTYEVKDVEERLYDFINSNIVSQEGRFAIYIRFRYEGFESDTALKNALTLMIGETSVAVTDLGGADFRDARFLLSEEQINALSAGRHQIILKANETEYQEVCNNVAGGDNVEYNGKIYTLKAEDGKLYLEIAEAPAYRATSATLSADESKLTLNVTISGSFEGQENVTLGIGEPNPSGAMSSQTDNNAMFTFDLSGIAADGTSPLTISVGGASVYLNGFDVSTDPVSFGGKTYQLGRNEAGELCLTIG